MSAGHPPIDTALVFEPDEGQRNAWNEAMARLDAQFALLVSRAMLPPAEFERLSTLSEAVKSARQVLATL